MLFFSLWKDLTDVRGSSFDGFITTILGIAGLVVLCLIISAFTSPSERTFTVDEAVDKKICEYCENYRFADGTCFLSGKKISDPLTKTCGWFKRR